MRNPAESEPIGGVAPGGLLRCMPANPKIACNPYGAVASNSMNPIHEGSCIEFLRLVSAGGLIPGACSRTLFARYSFISFVCGYSERGQGK